LSPGSPCSERIQSFGEREKERERDRERERNGVSREARAIIISSGEREVALMT